jgi:hypothetical protein
MCEGKGKAGQLSKHSTTSLQIWLARLSLLVRLRLFSVAEAEAEPFGDLDRQVTLVNFRFAQNI